MTFRINYLHLHFTSAGGAGLMVLEPVSAQQILVIRFTSFVYVQLMTGLRTAHTFLQSIKSREELAVAPYSIIASQRLP